jgi:hypothetical protein
MNTHIAFPLTIAISFTNAFGMIKNFFRPIVSATPHLASRSFNVPQIICHKASKLEPYCIPNPTPKTVPRLAVKPMSKYFALAAAMEAKDSSLISELQKQHTNPCDEEPVIVRNMQKAVTLFREKGLAEAQYLLGFCLLRGIGIKENIKEGFELLKKAANAGLAKAMYELGFCFLRGIRTNKNENVGIEWLNKAINQGSTNAMCELGCYLYRRSTTAQKRETDKDDARKLLLLAAKNGCAGAKAELERLERDEACAAANAKS